MGNTIPTGLDASAYHSARELLPLMKTHTIEQIRHLIAVSPEHEKELRQNEAHAETLIRFRRECLAAFNRIVGRPPKTKPIRVRPGGRVPVELRQNIRRALEAGCRPREVVNSTGVTYCTVLAIRREAGITERWNTKKLSKAQIVRAKQLLQGGLSWPKVARIFHVGTRTLMRACPHRKGTGRWRTYAAQTAVTR